jgi:nickel/cobalt exporter
MSGAAPALLAAAAGVGFGHAILPDHWVPLAVLGRTRRYPLSRIARLSSQATIEHAQDTIIGCILIATGIGFLALELTGHGHHHDHDHDHDGHHHDHDHDDHDQSAPTTRRLSGLAAVMVPFGAAASPDLTILPVFLAATTAGIATAVGSLVIFAAVTIGTIVGLTLAAARGGYQIQGEWLERWGNVFTAAVLVIIGSLVLLGII